MLKPLSTRLIPLLLLTLLSTGCAHKRLVKDGEDLNRQGRYELAVEKYKKALALKPKDKKTQQNLAFAEEELNHWLDEIYSQAIAAKQQGLQGRALLLYGKVAQLRKDSDAFSNYKQLHQQISEQAYYKLALHIPDDLSGNIARRLKHVRLIDKANQDNSNEFTAKINYSSPKFSSQKVKKQVTQQYVSGSETITNPDYTHLQQDIAEDRQHISEYTGKVDYQSHAVEDLRYHLRDLAKDKEIAQLRMNDAKPGSSQYYHRRNEVNRLTAAISEKEHQLSAQNSKLDAFIHKLDDYRKVLDKHLNELSYLPPTVEQEVYSDHTYALKQVTKTAAGNVSLSVKNGPTKTKSVNVKATDETHKAQPVIELSYNPLVLPSDEDMTINYRQKVASEAESLITAHARDHRKNLKEQAQRQSGVDQKLEGFVRYGLSGDDGVEDQTARKMRRMLEQEFGITGEFRINQLLKLFE